MQVLVPGVSCLCSPNELERAKTEGFKQIYMMTVNGMFKHHILRGDNRFICTQVKEIPGYTIPEVKPEIRFLPAGRIDMELWKQIVAFFKQVMVVKNSDVEAMIWILWSQAQGYFLHVPKQTISKASVRYEWDDVPDGASIIVDIHSHNTMGRSNVPM